MGMEKRLKAAALGMTIFLISMAGAPPVFATEAGVYMVTVRPSYTDPETGKTEDPGNNEAIGQGMTDRMCGSSGLLEVEESGNMYLTVRFYLSQFIGNVTFEERTGSSYISRTYQEMQTKAPVEGASNISEKYGYTDYRLQVGSLDSVFRGNAYIDAMGRNVVFFFTVSNPVKGSGDFVVTTRTEQPLQTEEALETAAAGGAAAENQDAEAITEQNDESGYLEKTEQTGQRTAGQTGSDRDVFFVNGSGEVNDPVTGIPQKPSVSGTGTQSGSSGTSYHLDTVYDLSQVPLAQARKLTEPILEHAVGITGMTGAADFQANAASMSLAGKDRNPNKTIMLALFSVAAVLAARFGFAMVCQRRNRNSSADRSASDQELTENPDFQAAVAKLDARYHAEIERLELEFREKQKKTGHTKNTGITVEAQR